MSYGGYVALSALLGTLAMLVPAPVAAQTGGAKAGGARATAPTGKPWVVPRTPDGHPDLQGIFANNNATPVERPKELADKPLLSDQELDQLKRSAAQLFGGDGDAAFGDSVYLAALRNLSGFKSTDTTGNYNQFWLVDRDWEHRTSLVFEPADGRIPALTAEGQRIQATAVENRKLHPADGPESYSYSLRCITMGLPNTFAGYNSYYQIIQSKDHVVIATEMMHDARIIPLDGRPHVSGDVRQWFGDSRGHWEGDTLVVDTVNFVDQSNQPFSSLRVGGDRNLHLIERFTRVAPDVVNYEFTIDDPTMWTKTWKAMIPLRAQKDQIFEFACHEGNESMSGSLNGSRVQEKQEAAAGTKSSR